MSTLLLISSLWIGGMGVFEIAQGIMGLIR